MAHPTESQTETYDRLVPMLTAAHKEMSELSRKKQDGIVSPLKIRNINRLLDQLFEVLGDDPSRGFLEKLDEETLPQNSDVVLLLSQWQAALVQFKKLHHGRDSDSREIRWFTVEDPRP